jgi:hypothetical protein
MWLVTVKLTSEQKHNPQQKQTGLCPIFPHGACTDVTGAHHTVARSGSREEVESEFEGLHITRLEEV